MNKRNKILIIFSVILVLTVIFTCVLIKIVKVNRDNTETSSTKSEQTTSQEASASENSENISVNDESSSENLSATENKPTVTESTGTTQSTTASNKETTTKNKSTKKETTTKKTETTSKKLETSNKITESTTSKRLATIFNAGNLNANTPVKDIEKELFNLVNQERAKNGLKRFVWNDNLHYFALCRAEETIITMDHICPDGRGFHTIFDDNNIDYSLVAENIAIGGNKDYSGTAQALFEGWMGSESHKSALLSSDYGYSAVGIAFDSSGTAYVVQLFYK